VAQKAKAKMEQFNQASTDQNESEGLNDKKPSPSSKSESSTKK